MTISEQIKVLCVRSNISVAELARRMGTTPQNFNSKMKRESFTISDLEYLAEAVGCSFERTSNRDVISLFSGAMGLDIGLSKAGLNIVIGQDFDLSCVATMRANGHKVLGGDIREINEADLLEQTGLAPGEPR